MPTSGIRITGFLLGLAAIFASTFGVGTLVGPVGGAASPAHDSSHASQQAGETHRGEPLDLPGGLMVSQSGYTLQLEQTRVGPGRQRLAFIITGPDGGRVHDYEVAHEKELHLIAVRRDFSGFQHVHPRRDASGTWSAPLDLRTGSWRLFADFHATGAEPLTLGTDLMVGGRGPRAAADGAPESRVARVDGYEVTLAGDLTPNRHSPLRLALNRGREPVTDLQPYLGAYGHLVALREGDMAYLHVHPDGKPGDGRTQAGPDVSFVAEVPSPGRYHLYLDFRHRGVVHTASFVLDAGNLPTTDAVETATDHDGGHDH